jgi:hypothetical protein
LWISNEVTGEVFTGVLIICTQEWYSVAYVVLYSNIEGRAMPQAVSRRPITAEVRVGPCWICGGQSGTGIGFSPSTSVFPCQYHSTCAALHGKTKKLIICITGLHNKPQGCSVSVASAAGPLPQKNIVLTSQRVLEMALS